MLLEHHLSVGRISPGIADMPAGSVFGQIPLPDTKVAQVQSTAMNVLFAGDGSNSAAPASHAVRHVRKATTDSTYLVVVTNGTSTTTQKFPTSEGQH